MMSSLMRMSGHLKSIKSFDLNKSQTFVRHLCLSYQWFQSFRKYHEIQGKVNAFESNRIQELEKELSSVKRIGGPSDRVLRNLLIQYCRRSHFWTFDDGTNDKIKLRVEEIVEEMAVNAYYMSDPIYSSLLEFYTNCEDINKALNYKQKISKTFPLDSYKVFNLSTLLAKNDLTVEAINLIKDENNQSAGRRRQTQQEFRSGQLARDDQRSDDKFANFKNQSINRLLNALIDKQIDTKVIKKVFLMCLELSAMKANKVIAGPLIKMHLIKRDYSSALDEFVFCADVYQTIPWSLELMRIFIEINDKKSLQTVVQKSNEIYGRNNTSLDLSAAYVYNGLLNEAKTEVKTIRRLKQQSIDFVCDKFIRDNKLNELKDFIEIIQTIDSFVGINGENLYQILIKEFNRLGQRDKAQEVLVLMKERNIDPSEHTLKLVNN